MKTPATPATTFAPANSKNSTTRQGSPESAAPSQPSVKPQKDSFHGIAAGAANSVQASAILTQPLSRAFASIHGIAAGSTNGVPATQPLSRAFASIASAASNASTESLALTEPVPLSLANLPKLGLSLGYEREKLKEGIVCIGPGNFSRAHLMMYLHRLMRQGKAHDFAVCGVGIMPGDIAVKEALSKQDNLYTVLVRSGTDDETTVVGAMTSYLHGPSEPEAVLEKLADPSIRVMYLTVTEAGYYRDKTTGSLDFKHPAVKKALNNTGTPEIWPEYVCAATRRRRANGAGGFTVWSGDNLPGNGHLTKAVTLDFIGATDPELRDWVAANVSFPNSMVDRITPRTTDAIKDIVAKHGIKDNWPVPTEEFTQFVVEDNFKNGRPPLEDVDVQMVANVDPFERMKLRLLNGQHLWMGFLGTVAGKQFVHDMDADPLFKEGLRRLAIDEVVPTLEIPPDTDLKAYCGVLAQRFANTAMADGLPRVSLDASDKLSQFLLDSVRGQLKLDGPIDMLSLGIAGWIRYLAGTDEAARPIKVVDAMVDELQPLARQAVADKDPRPVLACTKVFGDDLSQSERFINAVEAALTSLCDRGVAATLDAYLKA